MSKIKKNIVNKTITEYRNENGHPNCDKVIINEFVKNMTGGGF
jgi:hypothetical protein